MYFEIKYTESGFGKAKHDTEHINKFRDIYMPLLKNHKAINDCCKNEDFFLGNYQVMRNLVHIDKDSYVIFIYPEENRGIRQGALSAKKDIIENDWKDHFVTFTWEDLINKLKDGLESQNLINYYEKDFSDKYLRYKLFPMMQEK